MGNVAFLTKRGARPGDVVFLTKPLGVGIITTALKGGVAAEDHVAGAVDSMLRLNRKAALIFRDLAASACTDVTGFGFLGHLREMTAGAAVDAEVFFDQVPILEAAERLAGANPRLIAVAMIPVPIGLVRTIWSPG